MVVYDGTQRQPAHSGEFPQRPAQKLWLMGVVKGTSNAVNRGPENTVLAWPHLVYRELLLLLFTLAVVLTAGLSLNAPLPRNPSMARETFVRHPAGVVSLAYVAFLLVLPFIDQAPGGVGVWCSRRRIGIVVAFAVFTIAAAAAIAFGRPGLPF